MSAILAEMKSKDVLIPALLFAALSPGAILSLPSKAINSLSTSPKSVAIHAAVYAAALWSAIKYGMEKQVGDYDLVVPVLLFVVLSPGLLLQLPSSSIRSGSTSMVSIALHALVFAALYAALRVQFPDKYKMGASLKDDLQNALPSMGGADKPADSMPAPVAQPDAAVDSSSM